MKNIREFSEFSHENVDPSVESVVDLYSTLVEGGVSPSGGNCGQSAYAIYRWVRERTGKTVSIGVLTNAEDEDWLVNGEPDVYHVTVVVDGISVDETGVVSETDLLALAEDQYSDPNPQYYVFDMPTEAKKVLRIIGSSTNYTVDWNHFYDELERARA
jgi:hypothetical protein